MEQGLIISATFVVFTIVAFIAGYGCGVGVERERRLKRRVREAVPADAETRARLVAEVPPLAMQPGGLRLAGGKDCPWLNPVTYQQGPINDCG